MSAPRLILLALLALGLDQITKAAALHWLSQGVPVPILPLFNLSLGFNEGASFGMGSGIMAGKPWAMAALTGAITVGLAVAALRARTPWEAAGFALAVGGSLGNILDRLRQGSVTDFLDLYWQDWHWPTFNMADVAIVCGVGLILFSALKPHPKEPDHA